MSAKGKKLWRGKLDNDGLITEIYNYIWSIRDDLAPDLTIPDTIVFERGWPKLWYAWDYEDSALTDDDEPICQMGWDIKKILGHEITERNVVERFRRQQAIQKPGAGDVIAEYATYTMDKDTMSFALSFEYFDATGLGAFLSTKAAGASGVLQTFVYPKSVENTIIQATWSPQGTYLSIRKNNTSLEAMVPLQSKCATLDGPPQLSSWEIVTPFTRKRVERALNKLVAALRETDGIHVMGFVCLLKVDKGGQLFLTKLTSLRTLQHEANMSGLRHPVCLNTVFRTSYNKVSSASEAERSSSFAPSSSKGQAHHQQQQQPSSFADEGDDDVRTLVLPQYGRRIPDDVAHKREGGRRGHGHPHLHEEQAKQQDGSTSSTTAKPLILSNMRSPQQLAADRTLSPHRIHQLLHNTTTTTTQQQQQQQQQQQPRHVSKEAREERTRQLALALASRDAAEASKGVRLSNTGVLTVSLKSVTKAELAMLEYRNFSHMNYDINEVSTPRDNNSNNSTEGNEGRSKIKILYGVSPYSPLFLAAEELPQGQPPVVQTPLLSLHRRQEDEKREEEAEEKGGRTPTSNSRFVDGNEDESAEKIPKKRVNALLLTDSTGCPVLLPRDFYWRQRIALYDFLQDTLYYALHVKSDGTPRGKEAPSPGDKNRHHSPSSPSGVRNLATSIAPTIPHSSIVRYKFMLPDSLRQEVMGERVDALMEALALGREFGYDNDLGTRVDIFYFRSPKPLSHREVIDAVLKVFPPTVSSPGSQMRREEQEQDDEEAEEEAEAERVKEEEEEEQSASAMSGTTAFEGTAMPMTASFMTTASTSISQDRLARSRTQDGDDEDGGADSDDDSDSSSSSSSSTEGAVRKYSSRLMSPGKKEGAMKSKLKHHKHGSKSEGKKKKGPVLGATLKMSSSINTAPSAEKSNDNKKTIAELSPTKTTQDENTNKNEDNGTRALSFLERQEQLMALGTSNHPMRPYRPVTVERKRMCDYGVDWRIDSGFPRPQPPPKTQDTDLSYLREKHTTLSDTSQKHNQQQQQHETSMFQLVRRIHREQTSISSARRQQEQAKQQQLQQQEEERQRQLTGRRSSQSASKLRGAVQRLMNANKLTGLSRRKKEPVLSPGMAFWIQ